MDRDCRQDGGSEDGTGWAKANVVQHIVWGYLRRAVTGILKVAWGVVTNVHAAELDKTGMGDEEDRAVSGNSEKVATVAFLVPAADRLYLAVRK